MCRALLRPLLEAGLVVLLGLGVGLAANAADEKRGIALRKDHLRRQISASRSTDQPSGTAGRPDSPAATAAPADARVNLPFVFVDHATAVSIYEGEAYQYGDDIFIDARDDGHYAEGHIPGAYQFDHFRADRYLPELVPICQSAQRIVIYCNGGACEDSKFAAEDLAEQGVDPTKLLIYEAGIAQWCAEKLPIEIGERLSGQIQQDQD